MLGFPAVVRTRVLRGPKHGAKGVKTRRVSTSIHSEFWMLLRRCLLLYAVKLRLRKFPVLVIKRPVKVPREAVGCVIFDSLQVPYVQVNFVMKAGLCELEHQRIQSWVPRGLLFDDMHRDDVVSSDQDPFTSKVVGFVLDSFHYCEKLPVIGRFVWGSVMGWKHELFFTPPAPITAPVARGVCGEDFSPVCGDPMCVQM